MNARFKSIYRGGGRARLNGHPAALYSTMYEAAVVLKKQKNKKLFCKCRIKMVFSLWSTRPVLHHRESWAGLSLHTIKFRLQVNLLLDHLFDLIRQRRVLLWMAPMRTQKPNATSSEGQQSRRRLTEDGERFSSTFLSIVELNRPLSVFYFFWCFWPSSRSQWTRRSSLALKSSRCSLHRAVRFNYGGLE